MSRIFITAMKRYPPLSVTPRPRRALFDEKNGRTLSVLHVNKRGIFHSGFQNLGETLSRVLSVLAVTTSSTQFHPLRSRVNPPEGDD